MATESDIRHDALLPATAEQSWAAITTGFAGWLWPISIEPRAGGTVDGFGGSDVVTAWEADRHLAIRADGEDGWFNELDFRLEPRDNGTHLFYRHRTVFPEEFESQYDACRQHTYLYTHTLGEYLAHFAGRDATYVSADAPDGSRFDAVRSALGLTAETSVGDALSFEVPGVGLVEGVVDYVTPSFVGLRTPDALLRFLGRDGFGWPVGLSHHLFGDVEADKTKQAWENWLTGLYS